MKSHKSICFTLLWREQEANLTHTAHTRAGLQARLHACIHVCTHTYMPTHVHIHIHTHTHTHAGAHVHTNTCSHMPSHSDKGTCMYTHIYTYAHTRTLLLQLVAQQEQNLRMAAQHNRSNFVCPCGERCNINYINIERISIIGEPNNAYTHTTA